MRTKFITSFMLALICGLPLSAKVYTITSPNKKLVVNISVDKELKWDIKSGNSLSCSRLPLPFKRTRRVWAKT